MINLLFISREWSSSIVTLQVYAWGLGVASRVYDPSTLVSELEVGRQKSHFLYQQSEKKDKETDKMQDTIGGASASETLKVAAGVSKFESMTYPTGYTQGQAIQVAEYCLDCLLEKRYYIGSPRYDIRLWGFLHQVATNGG